jgi:thioredoxin-related protein
MRFFLKIIFIIFITFSISNSLAEEKEEKPELT